MNIKIKRHTPVRYPMSRWTLQNMLVEDELMMISNHLLGDIHHMKVVKDLHTGLDPQVDATPDWYEDFLEYNRVDSDKEWNKIIQRQIPRELTHWQRLTKLFKRKS